MKILICIPFEKDAPTGNSVAASRLGEGFERRGHDVAFMGATIASDDLRRFQPDAALVLHARRCAAALKAIAGAGVPIAISLRGTDINEGLDDPAVAAALSAGDALVVFHERFKVRLAAKNPSWAAKTAVVPNGVELPKSDVDYRRRLEIPQEAFLFATVAGLREVKRPLWPAPLLEGLREESPRLHWVHAGLPMEPDLARAMESLARRRPWVRHVDEVPHAEMDSFLRAADAVVSCSRSEGMPHAAREAMLAGRPLLLSDIEGHRLLAEPDEEALFFDDEAGFIKQARRLLDDPALRERLAAAGRRRVEADLARQDEIGAYLRLLEGLR